MKKSIISVVAILLIGALFVGCSGSDENTITVGGKNFTEQDILVFIVQGLLEDKTDLNIETKPFLGGTNVVAQALERGDLDIYVEYTGTALINIMGMETSNDPDTDYATVKERYLDDKELVWLDPLGFNNTYALAMREDRAEELGIETYSDLFSQAENFTIGATHEFLERNDGYIGLMETYGAQFGDTRGLDPGLTYAAVRDGEADVNDAFSTDGRIAAFNLKTLEDDLNFFPPYYAAPVVRQDALERHPELEDILNLLAGRLSEEAMSELNRRVDLDGENPRDVAHEWLESEGLIE